MIWTDISSTPGEYGGISPEASGACMASAWTRKETSMWPKWTVDASRSSVHARASIRLSWWASRSILHGNEKMGSQPWISRMTRMARVNGINCAPSASSVKSAATTISGGDIDKARSDARGAAGPGRARTETADGGTGFQKRASAQGASRGRIYEHDGNLFRCPGHVLRGLPRLQRHQMGKLRTRHQS